MSILPDPHSHRLNVEQAERAFGMILDGEPSQEDIEGFLVALADRGETAGEIAGAAKAMRARVVSVQAPDGAIDVCGTGGDGQHTLNVSTAVSLVIAACGVPVAKHGNRAASSKAGAADTLEALGLDMDAAAATAEKTIAEIGIGFLFAQKHHPALGPIMPIRRKIGRRTIFNLMGPLCNPAGVKSQLVGIASPQFVPIYAGAMAQLDTEHAMIVSGDEGLDELSLAGGNDVAEVRGSEVNSYRIRARDAELESAPIEAIRGDDATYNAEALKKLLDGDKSAYRDAVLLNAAAALKVAGKGSSWPERAAIAAEAIDSGAARELLGKWIELAQ
ncbi:anthranilate phosphoribosyltransferase [Altererythrobacter lutimaris]|uniref:Anthranilate phosphoribosyltransferase n=1 Tax=Altererythrobacter lutimaris TaxID=2743979 RepID=A0A850HAQ3_9SPHN|nr:anthranilate phosphoribosyltransferase [Altererythrobacter lutimaris]NVE93976.1 anthranilate phosphoribosyltransferase [Altererythrobacter lutimaris]